MPSLARCLTLSHSLTHSRTHSQKHSHTCSLAYLLIVCSPAQARRSHPCCTEATSARSFVTLSVLFTLNLRSKQIVLQGVRSPCEWSVAVHRNSVFVIGNYIKHARFVCIACVCACVFAWFSKPVRCVCLCARMCVCACARVCMCLYRFPCLRQLVSTKLCG